MKRLRTLAAVAVSLMGLLVVPSLASAQGGFDQYGYNYTARIFVGTSTSFCAERGAPPSCLSGSDVYANDQLVMKWNAAWDACNAHGYNDPTYCAGAWTDNEWNGKFPGGSGEVWHSKIIWVGSAGENSPYWRAGGLLIWNNYEVVMDQGFDPNVGSGHVFDILANPSGYGASA